MYDKHKKALEADIQSISIPPEDAQAAYKRIGYGYLEAAYAQVRLGHPCLFLLHSPRSYSLLVNGAWYIIDDIHTQSKSLRRCQSSSQVVQGDQERSCQSSSQVVQGDQDYLLVDLYFHQKSEDLGTFLFQDKGIKTLCKTRMYKNGPLNELDMNELILYNYSGKYRENNPDQYGRDQKVISEALSVFIESKIIAKAVRKEIYAKISHS